MNNDPSRVEWWLREESNPYDTLPTKAQTSVRYGLTIRQLNQDGAMSVAPKVSSKHNLLMTNTHPTICYIWGGYYP